MKRGHFVLAVLAVLLVASVLPASASGPVRKTITGCIVQGRLYSLHRGVGEATGKKERFAYPIRAQGIELERYEGQKIRARGNLLPGDRFHADPGSVEVLGPCEQEWRRVISEKAR